MSHETIYYKRELDDAEDECDWHKTGGNTSFCKSALREAIKNYQSILKKFEEEL